MQVELNVLIWLQEESNERTIYLAVHFHSLTMFEFFYFNKKFIQ